MGHSTTITVVVPVTVTLVAPEGTPAAAARKRAVAFLERATRAAVVKGLAAPTDAGMRIGRVALPEPQQNKTAATPTQIIRAFVTDYRRSHRTVAKYLQTAMHGPAGDDHPAVLAEECVALIEAADQAACLLGDAGFEPDSGEIVRRGRRRAVQAHLPGLEDAAQAGAV